MTDREEFEKFWESHRLYPDWNTTVWKAWQARGELDAVKIKELEAKLAIQQTMPMKYKRMEFNAQLQKENEELTAKLDKAREALGKILVGYADKNNVEAISTKALQELDK